MAPITPRFGGLADFGPPSWKISSVIITILRTSTRLIPAPLLSSIRFRSGLRRRRFRWSPAATETRPESGRAGADHGRAQPRPTRPPARPKTDVQLRKPPPEYPRKNGRAAVRERG